MRIYNSPGAIKKFRNTAWEFQVTFQTPPLKELGRFVEAIMSALPRMQSGVAFFDEVVFEPRYGLPRLYEKHAIEARWYGDDLTMEAENAAESRELLEAVLSEWIDFLFVPAPKRFVIYADHDQFATFLAHRKSGLTGVTVALEAAKFRRVDYVRKW